MIWSGLYEKYFCQILHKWASNTPRCEQSRNSSFFDNAVRKKPNARSCKNHSKWTMLYTFWSEMCLMSKRTNRYLNKHFHAIFDTYWTWILFEVVCILAEGINGWANTREAGLAGGFTDPLNRVQGRLTIAHDYEPYIIIRNQGNWLFLCKLVYFMYNASKHNYHQVLPYTSY